MWKKENKIKQNQKKEQQQQQKTIFITTKFKRKNELAIFIFVQPNIILKKIPQR